MLIVDNWDLVDRYNDAGFKEIVVSNIALTTNYVENEIRIFSTKDDKNKNRYKAKNYFEFTNLTFTDLKAYNAENHLMFDKYFDFIRFIEILKGFGSNKLEKKKEYKVGNIIATRRQKNEVESLHLNLYSLKEIYLDKIECLSVATFLSKLNQNFNPIYQ